MPFPFEFEWKEFGCCCLDLMFDKAGMKDAIAHNKRLKLLKNRDFPAQNTQIDRLSFLIVFLFASHES